MRSFEAGTSGKEREADHSSMTSSCTGGAFQPGLQRKTLSQKHKTSNRAKTVCGSAGRVLAWPPLYKHRSSQHLGGVG